MSLLKLLPLLVVLASPRPLEAAPRTTPAKGSSAHWSQLVKEIPKSRHLHVVFDVDDTLVRSFKSGNTTAPDANPEVPTQVLRDLQKLASRPHTRVTLLSGKMLKKLEEMFGDAKNVALIGNFGSETRVDGKYVEAHAAAKVRGTVGKLHGDLEAIAMRMGIPAKIVRDKGTSITIHKEHLPTETWERFKRAILERARREKSLTARAPDENIDITPAGLDKGTALRKHLDNVHERGWERSVTALFVGDSGGPDGGDEPAFRLVAAHGGAGILVGDSTGLKSAATHRAKSVEDVGRFIRVLASQRRETKGSQE